MRFSMRSSGPPPGHHQVKFVDIRDFDGGDQSYGPAVSLVFQVTEGTYQGEEIFVVCSAKLTQKSKLGKFMRALNGGPINLGDDIDTDAFVGTKGVLIVEEDADGTARPASFMRT